MSVKYAILRWKNQTSVQSTDMSITLNKIVNHFSLFLVCISSIWRVRIWEIPVLCGVSVYVFVSVNVWLM